MVYPISALTEFKAIRTFINKLILAKKYGARILFCFRNYHTRNGFD